MALNQQKVVYRNGGIGFTGVLMCLLIGLKLGGVANISWLMICLVPLFVLSMGLIFAMIMGFVVLTLAWLVDR